MKFRFCGDLDAPDWLLMEISTLAVVSVARFKVMCVQVIEKLLGGEIDYAAIAETAESEVSTSDIKASIAAMSFILSSAARHDVDQSTLTNELLQLGLPKEHSDSLRAPYQDKKEALRTQFAKTSLRLPRVSKLDWRVDYVVSSSKMADVESPSVSLKFVTDNGSAHSFDVSSDKFAVLYSELKAARELMDTVE